MTRSSLARRIGNCHWVGGEVRTPGMIEMNGDLDAYQAIIQAGDFLPTARQNEVALIRRGPGGVRMMRAADLRPRRGEVIALRRGDIIFVPRSTLSEVANFVSLIRNALPIRRAHPKFVENLRSLGAVVDWVEED